MIWMKHKKREHALGETFTTWNLLLYCFSAFAFSHLLQQINR